MSGQATPGTEVEALLERALHDRLADGSVDLPRLTAGTRRGIRRARTRRYVTVAACTASVGVAVAAAPTGLAHLQRPAPNVVVTTPAASATAAPVPTPSPTLGPDDPDWVAYPIPDAVGFTRADLRRPMIDSYMSGQYRLQPTVDGQSCQDPAITGPEPIAGRQWGWADEESNRPQRTVIMIVTGWERGTGAARFTDLVEDTGACRWLLLQHPASTAGLDGDDVWAASDEGGRHGLHGRAAVRLGDVIVAVEVTDPDLSETAAAKEARRLVMIAAERLRTSGLSAVKGGRG